MKLQQYYNLLCKSARDGTFPSIKEGSGLFCLYRSDDGKHKCAVGVLIDDDVYESYFEG